MSAVVVIVNQFEGPLVLVDNAVVFAVAGGGSCGTCVVSVLDNADWEERPNFEAQRLKKYPAKARLSCNTVIEGDATVIVNPPKLE